MAERFTNVAARAKFTYKDGDAGSSDASAAPVNLTIDYDPADNSYTLTTDSASQKFITDNNFGTTSYRLIQNSGGVTTTDQLELTGAAENSTQPLIYRYVGGGYWQRSVEGATSEVGELVAFVYGVETPAADVPRTGTGEYAVDLVGAMGVDDEDHPLVVAGIGTLTADFAAGTVDTQAFFLLARSNGERIDPASRYDGILTGTGTISSSDGLFSGTITIDTIRQFSGTWAGRFFGPAADEVGAAFAATDASGNSAVAGTLLGRAGPGYTPTPTPTASLGWLDGLTSAVTFANGLEGLSFESASGSLSPVATASVESAPVLTYDPDTQTFTLPSVADSSGTFDYFGVGPLSFGPGDLSATQNDPDFALYEVDNGGSQSQLSVFTGQVGGVQLTYSSFAGIVTSFTDGTGALVRRDYTLVPFGSVTPSDNIPTTGNGRFNGRIFGTASRTAEATGGTAQLGWRLTGTSIFVVSFAANYISGQFSPVGTSLSDGSTTDFGTMSVYAPLDRATSSFSGQIGADTTSSFRGYLYGPNAEELTALFNVTTDDMQARLNGIIVATQ